MALLTSTQQAQHFGADAVVAAVSGDGVRDLLLEQAHVGAGVPVVGTCHPPRPLE